jgi:hypothetical protein
MTAEHEHVPPIKPVPARPAIARVKVKRATEPVGVGADSDEGARRRCGRFARLYRAP